MIESLPLFPLAQPLFPGIQLDLQIFEQRYLRLVRESMRCETGFGIVAISEGNEAGTPVEPHSVGVEVSIVDWRQQSNGLLGLTVEGNRRFKIESTELEEDGLLLANVQWLEDPAEGANLSRDQLEALENLLRDLCQHPSLDWLEIDEDISALELSWMLAQVLPVATDVKVDLLDDSDTDSRMRKIQVLVEQLSQAS